MLTLLSTRLLLLVFGVDTVRGIVLDNHCVLLTLANLLPESTKSLELLAVLLLLRVVDLIIDEALKVSQ
jgi:hypothetical protein